MLKRLSVAKLLTLVFVLLLVAEFRNLLEVNLFSALFMAKLTFFTDIASTIFYVFALYILIQLNRMKQWFSSKHWLENIYIKKCILAATAIYTGFKFLLSIPILLMVVFFNTHLNNVHQERLLDNDVYYVHSNDIGAFGNAYHTIYLKCDVPFKQYEHKFIGKTNHWYGDDFILSKIDNYLMIRANQSIKVEIETLPLKDVNCA